jgi:hypothetical protein
MGNLLIAIGIVLLAIGVAVNLGVRLPVLPGDILLRREGVTVYIPIVTSILLSIILTILINIYRR